MNPIHSQHGYCSICGNALHPAAYQRVARARQRLGSLQIRPQCPNRFQPWHRRLVPRHEKTVA